jgi:hypothetical protein
VLLRPCVELVLALEVAGGDRGREPGLPLGERVAGGLGRFHTAAAEATWAWGAFSSSPAAAAAVSMSHPRTSVSWSRAGPWLAGPHRASNSQAPNRDAK